MKMKIWPEKTPYFGVRLGIKFHGQTKSCNGTDNLISLVDSDLSSWNVGSGGWMLSKPPSQKLIIKGSGKLSGFSWEATKICPGDLRKMPLEQVRDFLVEQLEDLCLKLWQWKMDQGGFQPVVSLASPCKTCGHTYSKHLQGYKGICTVTDPGCPCNGFIPNGKPKKKAFQLKELDFKYKFNYIPEYPITIDKVTGLPVDDPKFCSPKSFMPGYKHCFHQDYKTSKNSYMEPTIHCCICKKSILQKAHNKYA